MKRDIAEDKSSSLPPVKQFECDDYFSTVDDYIVTKILWTFCGDASTYGNARTIVAFGATCKRLHSIARDVLKNKFDKQVADNIDIDLSDACANNKKDDVEQLIKAGANVNKQNRDKPLHSACSYGHKEIVESLAWVFNKTDFSGRIPIHIACCKGYKEIVDILIRASADVNKVGFSGWTPLHSACCKGYKEIVDSLIRASADVNKAENVLGLTPLHSACTYDIEEVVETLIRAGADVNKVGTSGETPLHTACSYSIKEVVETLIRAGADVNKADNNGKTPLDVAHKRGSKDIIEILHQK